MHVGANWNYVPNMMTITDNEARFLVLEMTVGALVAQLPQVSLEEVVSMLAFVAGLTEDAENLVDGPGEEQLARVRHYANEMLSRAMASRKPDRPAKLDPQEALAWRYHT